MNLEKWRLFVQAAELGSLTKTAALRDTAQSAVSRQIRALERECGGRLFDRTGRGITLTETGKRIFPRVKAWTLEAEHLAKEVRTTAGSPIGVVRLGTLESTAQPLISVLFRRARALFPGIQLRVFDGSSGQLTEALERGEIDIAIVFRYGKDKSGDEYPLVTVDTYLVGPANDAVTRAPTVNFLQLDQLPLVLPGVPNTLRVVLDQIARRKRISLSVVMESESLAVQKDIVAEGGVYTILGTHAIARELQSGRLQASRIVAPGIERTITLCTSKRHAPTLACREVVKLIRTCVDELADTAAWKHGRRKS